MSPNLGCKEVSNFGEMQKSGQSRLKPARPKSYASIAYTSIFPSLLPYAQTSDSPN